MLEYIGYGTLQTFKYPIQMILMGKINHRQQRIMTSLKSFHPKATTLYSLQQMLYPMINYNYIRRDMDELVNAGIVERIETTFGTVFRIHKNGV